MDLETVIINGSFYKKVPKFYYKFNSNDLSISFDKKEGYSIHRAFKNKGHEIPYFLCPMYTASVEGSDIVYRPNLKPASVSGDLQRVGIKKASDIIDYCLDKGSHLMTIFESGAIQMLELYEYQRNGIHIEPRDWSRDVPNTGTYRNTLGIYDTSGTLWNYVMGLTRPLDIDTGGDFFVFKESLDITKLTSTDVFKNLKDIKDNYDVITLPQCPDICKYIEYRGPTDCFENNNVCTDMFIYSNNTDFYKTESSLTTDGIFSYHRKGLFCKVFACFNAVKGKGTCSIDLFSHNNDVWYNSGFREVRY